MQPGAQVGGQVARRAVVTGDDQRRLVTGVLRQSGDEVGAERL